MNPKHILIAAALLAGFVFAARPTTYGPGTRVQVLAHNAYPDHGKYGDRLDRAIVSGRPFAVEEDLAWIDGKSLMIHGAKNATKDDPTLESYFFPKVRPVIEKALKAGNQGDWPVVTLYLDIKNDPPEHLEEIAHVLDKYNDWLTTATKPADASTQAPLEVKPMMVLVEDKVNDIKQDFFYDRVPVGGKIRVFGSVTKLDPNPQKKLSKKEAVEAMFQYTPAQIFAQKANTYHRWFGGDWAIIEKGGQENAAEWTSAEYARLKSFVDEGHKKGYFVGFYCLNGYAEADNMGWDKEYNFGSKDAALARWKAAVQAKADFISTDQYEDLSRTIASFK